MVVAADSCGSNNTIQAVGYVLFFENTTLWRTVLDTHVCGDKYLERCFKFSPKILCYTDLSSLNARDFNFVGLGEYVKLLDVAILLNASAGVSSTIPLALLLHPQ
ncbi:hypothetical protein Tco_0777747 [Tanacetum coccineum]